MLDLLYTEFCGLKYWCSNKNAVSVSIDVTSNLAEISKAGMHGLKIVTQLGDLEAKAPATGGKIFVFFYKKWFNFKTISTF